MKQVKYFDKLEDVEKTVSERGWKWITDNITNWEKRYELLTPKKKVIKKETTKVDKT